MKRFSLMIASIALLAVCSSDAFAQGRGFMRMMGGGMQLDSMLLVMEEVQEELNFTDEQKDGIVKKAEEIVDSMRSEMRDAFSGGGGDREEMMEIMEEVMEELREEEKEVVALLNDDQKARLKQLRYQRMGTAMYQDEGVQETLGLSDDQKESVEDAVNSNQDAMREAMREAMQDGDRGAMGQIMQDMQKELAAALEDILTDKQKEMVVEMKGDEFKFPERQRRRGGNRSDF